MKFLTLSLLYLSLMAMSQLSIAQQPELIDREVFFGEPEISGGQLSPDGRYLSFLKPHLGTRNIWIKEIDEDFDDAKPMTADTTRPISGYFWSRDGKYILYVQDKGGDENFHVYAVDPNQPVDEKTGVPPARNITNYEGARAQIYRVPRSKPDVIFVGLNDRDPEFHDLYEVEIETGKRSLIYENTERIAGYHFDHNDVMRMATRTDDMGSTEILVITDTGFKSVYRANVVETAYVAGFTPDNSRAYLVTNVGNDFDLTQLMLMNPMTGETEFMERDPESRVDFGGMSISQVTKEIIATVYTDAKERIYFKDKEYEADYQLLKETFGDVEINFNSSTEDEMTYLISVSSDLDPGSVHLFDRKTKNTTFQYRPRPEIPIKSMSPMTPVSYKSFDGLEIPAYLTLPKGLEPNDLPAVLLVHGGPWARDYWGYSSYAQFLANRGYAVLSMNFRGSSGYGKQFLNAGNGEWGRKMQDDVTAGARYLIEKGIADTERIAIMGGSYGGYATLAALTFTPDEFACGVDIVGPSNLNTLLETVPAYWESFRKILYARMADPNTEEGKKWLHERSPLNYADQIKVPLLIVQGANDPRVKQAESDQIVVAMRDLGLPVEYLNAPDEGHGYARPVNQMAFIAATEKFLSTHIQGRFQASMTDEVAKRLEEITVDIEEVELPKAMTEEEMGGEMPVSTGQVKTGTFSLDVHIESGGQSIPMSLSRTVSKGAEGWMASEEMTSPMGDITSEVVLNEKTLMPLSSEFTQGSAAGELRYSEDAISGSMNMGENSQPISAQLDAPVCADGVGMSLYVASLDLHEGFSALLRSYSIAEDKVKHFDLTVQKQEEIEVDAGTFQTWMVEMVPADGSGGKQTIWIDKADRLIVKESAALPQMGGAVMTSELREIK